MAVNPRKEKALAIALRKQGRTYSEILTQVPVAKSTLSLWLRSVNLVAPQQQRITQLRKDAQRRGAEAQRNKRIVEIEDLINKGREDVGKLSDRELWLIGTALYWAEGSKQRESNISTGVLFTNSDPLMLTLFLKWLAYLGVPDSDLHFEIYAHKNREKEVPEFQKWWSKELSIPTSKLGTIYFKSDKIKTNRKDIKDLYHGLIRITVKSSTSLNRQINGWALGIANQ